MQLKHVSTLKFLDPSQYEKVEYILLDPPCSGSGMTNRFNIFGDSSSNNPYGTDRLFSLSTLQSKMLFFALQNFPNAKKLVYSTCSVNVEENEQVLSKLFYIFLLFFNANVLLMIFGKSF